MADILPRALPAAVTIPDDSAFIVDDGINVKKATPALIVNTGRPLANQAEAEAGVNSVKAMTPLTTAQAIAALGETQFATAAQGALADSAVQPGDLATVATTGDYGDLDNLPTLGTAAAQNSTAFATAAQGALADSAIQSGEVQVPSDIDATGTPSASTYLDGSGAWSTPSGAGDMAKAIYDPNSVEADAFDSAYTAFDPSATDLTATDVQAAIEEVAGNGAWVKRELRTGITGASAVFTGYSDALMIRISGFIRPSTDDVSIGLRTSTNNGSSYDAGASDYTYQRDRGQGTTPSADAANAASILISANRVGNGASEGCKFSLEISRFNKAAFMWLNGNTTCIDASALYHVGDVFGTRNQATARDAFQIIPSSGNIADGEVLVEVVVG